MRRTKEEAEQTRQALLDAALRIFSTEGYQAARLQDVARAAGVTRGAIYHHFENKADLYRTLIEEASARGNRAIEAAIATGGRFGEICRQILINTMELIATDPRFRQTLALSLFKTGVSPELADLENRRIREAEGFIHGIAGFMQHGINTGELRGDLSPRVLARAFIAYQNGLAWLWLANEQFFPLAEEAPELADILLYGLLARDGL